VYPFLPTCFSFFIPGCLFSLNPWFLKVGFKIRTLGHSGRGQHCNSRHRGHRNSAAGRDYAPHAA